MNTQVLTAQETEYAGVTFRSKSEAIMARTFDLNHWLWEYEPDHLKTGDLWVPDFWVVTRGADHRLWSVVIEFKPRGTTEAYRRLLASRFDELERQLYGHFSLLICGSPFDEDIFRTIELYNCGTHQYEKADSKRFVGAAIFGCWEEAKSYRFDLA